MLWWLKHGSRSQLIHQSLHPSVQKARFDHPVTVLQVRTPCFAPRSRHRSCNHVNAADRLLPCFSVWTRTPPPMHCKAGRQEITEAFCLLFQSGDPARRERGSAGGTAAHPAGEAAGPAGVPADAGRDEARLPAGAAAAPTAAPSSCCTAQSHTVKPAKH